MLSLIKKMLLQAIKYQHAIVNQLPIVMSQINVAANLNKRVLIDNSQS